MVTVERVGEDAWQRLKHVRLAALTDAPDAFGSSIARERSFQESHWRMRLRGSSWWLARHDDGDRPHQAAEHDVGLVCAMQEPGAPDDDRHVVSLWVAPDDRRHGIGSALLTRLLDDVGADGARTVSLWLVEGNRPAAELYRRHGLAPTGARMALGRDPSQTEERWELVL